jgi:beta-glucosidase
MHHVLVAHAESLERMRSMGQDNCGIVLNFEATQAGTDRPEDIAAAARQDAINNRWFIQAIAGQGYPTEALEGLLPHMPKGWEDDLARIAAPLDWLGVNYYTRGLVTEDKSQPWPHLKGISGPLDKTQMGWEIYPDGLYSTLTRMKRDYVGDLPIYVTENGMARDESKDQGNTGDVERIRFIEDHFNAARRAIADGVNLRGFFYWSLLDNYEWAFGYEKRFGIVHVDYETLQRSPKASYHALRSMLYR